MRFTFALLVVASCGGEPRATSTVTLAPTSTASTITIATPASPTGLMACTIGSSTPPPRGPRNPPEVAMMSEPAAKAKRLFDAERWNEAVDALAKVVSGETGDDAGTQQLAEYHVAIALYRSRRFSESYKTFHAIAEKRNHVKQAETILWLAKLALDQPELVSPFDFAFYTKQDVAMFDNANQHTLYEELLFMLGRSRMQTHELAEADELLALAGASEKWGHRASECREIVRKSK